MKHAVPLGPVDLALMAKETTFRGLADGLIVTGPVTGQPAVAGDVATVRQAVPDGLLLVGSGVDGSNTRQLLAQARRRDYRYQPEARWRRVQPDRPGAGKADG